MMIILQHTWIGVLQFGGGLHEGTTMNNYYILTYINLRPMVGEVLDKQGNDIIMQCHDLM